MARIRTIKPEFFRHAELFRAERATGLPLRVAFAGLWTVCDRDGRFKWAPEALKLDCLPWDDVDFGAVLMALWRLGMVGRYTHAGKVYGYVPSWGVHQVVPHREAKSVLPAPEDSNILTPPGAVEDVTPGNCTATAVQLQGNCTAVTGSFPVITGGKGREGKGIGREGEQEGKGTGTDTALAPAGPDPSWFSEFASAYPANRRQGGYAAQSAYVEAFRGAVDPLAHRALLLAALALWCGSEEWQTEARYIPNMSRWLSEQWWLRTPTPRAPPVSEQTKRTMAGAAAFLASGDV